MTTTAEKDAVVANTSRIHPTTLWQQSWIMVKRNMIHTRRMPEMLSDVTIQPIMFVVLFAYVFGASIQTDSASYKEFLLPGIMGQTRPSCSPRSSWRRESRPISRRASSTGSGRYPSGDRRC